MNEFPNKCDEYRLLEAMGWETANIHLGSRASAGIGRDVAKRRGHWLRAAAKAMVKATASDWKDWKNS